PEDPVLPQQSLDATDSRSTGKRSLLEPCVLLRFQKQFPLTCADPPLLVLLRPPCPSGRQPELSLPVFAKLHGLPHLRTPRAPRAEQKGRLLRFCRCPCRQSNRSPVYDSGGTQKLASCVWL